MGWVSYLEDIDELLTAIRSPDPSTPDGAGIDPNREARIDKALQKLLRLRAEVMESLELATDPDCEPTIELIESRRLLVERSEQVTTLHDQVDQLRRDVAAKEENCVQLRKENSKLNGLLASCPKSTLGSVMEQYLSKEQAERHKPNP